MTDDELTPALLIERLVAAYGVATEDALAGRAPNSLRTLKRWKKQGFPNNVQAAIVILREAGLLRPVTAPVDEAAAQRDRIARGLAAIAEGQREVFARVAELGAQLGTDVEAGSEGRARPRRSR